MDDLKVSADDAKFQHTAARRRLRQVFDLSKRQVKVSTHSRPKAAAVRLFIVVTTSLCFNTQPPEGGCPDKLPG